MALLDASSTSPNPSSSSSCSASTAGPSSATKLTPVTQKTSTYYTYCHGSLTSRHRRCRATSGRSNCDWTGVTPTTEQCLMPRLSNASATTTDNIEVRMGDSMMNMRSRRLWICDASDESLTIWPNRKGMYPKTGGKPTENLTGCMYSYSSAIPQSKKFINGSPSRRSHQRGLSSLAVIPSRTRTCWKRFCQKALKSLGLRSLMTSWGFFPSGRVHLYTVECDACGMSKTGSHKKAFIQEAS